MENSLQLRERRVELAFLPPSCVLKGRSDDFVLFPMIFRGASLLLLCRNQAKMSAAAEEIRQKSPGAKILEFQLDLADTKTVSRAIKDIKDRKIMIDVLVLNAGLYYYDQTENLYNINSVQVVNHFSHFYLLNELLENLKV